MSELTWSWLQRPTVMIVANVADLLEAGRMEPDDLAALREATGALIEGDSAPFVSLIDEEMVWRGVRSWVPWQMHVPH